MIDCFSAEGELAPGCLPRAPIVDDKVPTNAWQGGHLLICACKADFFSALQVVVDVGGRVVHHVFTGKFALPE